MTITSPASASQRGNGWSPGATLATLLALGLLTSGGCESAPSTPDAATPIASDAGLGLAPEVEAFFETRRRELCRIDVRCGGEGLPCHPAYGITPRWARLLAAGQGEFNPERAEECLSLLRAQDRCETPAIIEACDPDPLLATGGPIAGAIQEGEPCTWPLDLCAEDLRCDRESCTCVPATPLGGACDDLICGGIPIECTLVESSCEDTHLCDPDSLVCTEFLLPQATCDLAFDCGVPGFDLELYCVEGECQPLPAHSEGDPCARDLWGEGICGGGLVCDNPTLVGATCITPRQAGEPCSRDSCDPRLDVELCVTSNCADDLFCNALEGGVCVPRPVEGEACDGFARCTDPAPHCVDGRCSRMPEGALCSTDFARPVPDCPEGFRCDERFQCQRILELGTACERSSQCEYGARCDRGECRKVVLPGDRCGPDAICPDTLACRDGRCVPRPTRGQGCDSMFPCLDSICADGRCIRLEAGRSCGNAWECEGQCADGICQEPGDLGEPCTGGDINTCREGLFCNGLDCVPECPEP